MSTPMRVQGSEVLAQKSKVCVVTQPMVAVSASRVRRYGQNTAGNYNSVRRALDEDILGSGLFRIYDGAHQG